MHAVRWKLILQSNNCRCWAICYGGWPSGSRGSVVVVVVVMLAVTRRQSELAKDSPTDDEPDLVRDLRPASAHGTQHKHIEG